MKKVSESRIKEIIRNNNIEDLQALLNTGLSVNTSFKNGYTVLQYAILCENIAAAKLLIAQGADLHTKDDSVPSPLMLAIITTASLGKMGQPVSETLQSGMFELIDLLLSKVKDLNEVYVLTCKEKEIGIDPDKPELGEREVYVRESILTAIANLGNEGFVKEVITKGADLEFKNQDGATALLIAMENKNYLITKLLLEAGAAVDISNSLQQTPLYHAIINNWTDIAALLIKKGVDINTFCGNRSWTPIMWASHSGNTEIIRLLHSNGADLTITSSEYKASVINVAADDETIRLLLKLGAIAQPSIGIFPAVLASENTSGVVVDNLLVDYPADKAGIIKGDIIVSLNQQSIQSFAELKSIITSCTITDEVEVTILRGKKRITKKIKIGVPGPGLFKYN
jgi:ankyrin repeat protein